MVLHKSYYYIINIKMQAFFEFLCCQKKLCDNFVKFFVYIYLCYLFWYLHDKQEKDKEFCDAWATCLGSWDSSWANQQGTVFFHDFCYSLSPLSKDHEGVLYKFPLID